MIGQLLEIKGQVKGDHLLAIGTWTLAIRHWRVARPPGPPYIKDRVYVRSIKVKSSLVPRPIFL